MTVQFRWRKLAMNDFDSRLKRLESISEKLRSGEISIDEATGLFEEGMKLSRDLSRELQHMEKRIEILMNDTGKQDAPPELSLFGDAGEEEPDGDTAPDTE
jgi:exodeoxyribonuclease VII small subunit